MYGLKLIWRMLTGDSLWGKWIKERLLKGKSFWEVKVKTHMGSWMWRKMLKLRGVAKSFYMKELGNGRHTSFWFDKWSEKGVLSDLLGERGIIDLGVAKNATVEEALLVTSRRRSHRRGLLNDLEKELSTVASNLNVVNEDISLWKGKSRYR